MAMSTQTNGRSLKNTLLQGSMWNLRFQDVGCQHTQKKNIWESSTFDSPRIWCIKSSCFPAHKDYHNFFSARIFASNWNVRSFSREESDKNIWAPTNLCLCHPFILIDLWRAPYSGLWNPKYNWVGFHPPIYKKPGCTGGLYHGIWISPSFYLQIIFLVRMVKFHILSIPKCL